MIGAVAVLAEAAADTVSSEAGQGVASKARMILGFQRAAIGTNGAISFAGTLAGCIAASAVAWTASLFDVIAWRWAVFENEGKMGNDSVNFVSTVFAADLALFAVVLLERL